MDRRDWLLSEDPAAMLAYLYGTGRRGEPCQRHPVASDRKLRLFACACCRQVWDLLPDERSRRAVLLAETDDPWSSPDVGAIHRDAHNARQAVPYRKRGNDSNPVWEAAWAASMLLFREREPLTVEELCHDRWGLVKRDTQAALLREIIGDPWEPVSLIPCVECHGSGRICYQDLSPDPLFKRIPDHLPAKVLMPPIEQRTCHRCNGSGRQAGIPREWLTPSVLSLARVAYDQQDWSALGPLSDALEEAGCSCQPLLMHLRGKEIGYRKMAMGPYDHDYEPYWRPLRGPHTRGCWSIDCILGQS